MPKKIKLNDQQIAKLENIIDIEKSSNDEIRYILKNNIEEIPKCLVCNKSCYFVTSKLGYSKFCSDECKNSEQGKNIRKRKMIENNLAKHGVESTNQLQSVKDKKSNSVVEKYGVDNVFKNEEVKKQIRENRQNKFNSFNNKEKIKQSVLNKYGVDNVFKNEEVKKKLLETKRKNKYPSFLQYLQYEKLKPLFTYEDYINNEDILFECERCGKIFGRKVNHNELRLIYCSCTTEGSNWSKYELELQEIISEYTSVERNKMFEKKYELDLYLPDFNLGIEFNGIYWHSNKFKQQKYHQEKYLFFKQVDIEVIQIFENEWLSSKQIVLSIIKSKLKLNETIYARKCIVKEIDNKMYANFCEQNHLQGTCVAKVKLGLFYNNELVQTISLSKPRFNNSYQWELIRSCTKLGSNIVGGFNKLITYFKRNYNPESIITYCDARYFNGHGYQQAGFELTELTSPDFFYFHKNDCRTLYHRTIFQKHMLSKKLKIYDPNKTAELNMIENGYNKIFDAGNLKFVWTNKKKEE